jgi:hypothetical protein
MSITILYNNLEKFGAFQGLDEESSLNLCSVFKITKRSNSNSRYRNMRVEYGGRVYHSLSEAYYGYVLDTLLENKEIKNVEHQVVYKMPGLENKKVIKYIADFVVTSITGKEYVIDVKGRLTTDDKVKLAYWRYCHNKDIYIVMTTGKDRFDISFLK